MIIKRLFDLLISLIALLVLSPIFFAVAAAILVESTGPVIFKQVRVGKGGRLFNIYKFRTMYNNSSSSALQLTLRNDSRITKVGRFLRNYKIDELPQLFNVIYGQMSLVGPRPEVPKYVNYYPENIKHKILSVLPGITDNASIVYKDESALLDAAKDPEITYINEVLPVKLKYYIDYIENRSMSLDFLIIFKTIRAIFF